MRIVTILVDCISVINDDAEHQFKGQCGMVEFDKELDARDLASPPAMTW
jgi:hypothetical protein